jgi:putative transposase/transposase-like zinc-binding protein
MHRGALEAAYRLSRAQRRVLTDIGQCRTAALGGHLDACLRCGYERPAYNSCRNRHCPKCQSLVQEEWIAERSKVMLDVGHFHVVFTLPGALRPLARFAPRSLYQALFAAASGTLVDLATDKLKATLGVTMVLHTWTRKLTFHPHVHAIVTAGGLADDGRWAPRRGRFLFHVRVMGKLFRGKMMDQLRRLHAAGQFAGFDAFADPMAFDALCAKITKLNWNVYAKAPFAKRTHVLEYLARYTHRVGIAGSRLLAVSSKEVSFKTKGDGVETVSPVELLRRFVQHVLPDRFHKIRHYGLYNPRCEVERAAAAALVNTIAARSKHRPTRHELLFALTGRDLDVCPICRAPLTRLPLPDQQARAPPAHEAE